MKADWNDAPDYITRHPRKRRSLGKLIPGLIGTVITLAVLQMAGSAFLQGTAQSIAEKRIHPKQAAVAEISRADPAPVRDWDKVVEEVAARGAMSKPVSNEPQNGTAARQTVFTDVNYVPRGADNVLSLKESITPIKVPKPTRNNEITVVGNRPRMKDRACWPHKEGSVERRNCRASIGLIYRD